jgi:CRISPR-associated endonuclease/helicase Cas3
VTGDLLAHSAPRNDPARPQGYAEHVRNVSKGARERARAMLAYSSQGHPGLLEAIEVAAVFHDLGKLGKKNQQALAKGRGERLPTDHIDAGVAHTWSRRNEMAAWLIRAHHSPGLPSRAAELAAIPGWLPLRGRRCRSKEPHFHDALIRLTDRNLPNYLERHRAVSGEFPVAKANGTHGLAMRLALSCLVDADHEDSAHHDTLRSPPDPPAAQWGHRIAALDQHVATLSGRDPARDADRQQLYDTCRSVDLTEPIVSCQAAVGLGKTFAVARYLLAQARKHRLRRIFIVAPFTNIISQTAERLREALVLPGENAAAIVAEHHHNADFGSLDQRELATLWRAPIVVTTAVQFFETLAACQPTRLRKLHELPGSAVVIDEAHAAIPPHLWPQNWLWLHELAKSWSCRFVLASGSLTRFWEEDQVISSPCKLPELTSEKLLLRTAESERDRLSALRLSDQPLTRPQLVAHVAHQAAHAGPVLVILNTVQSAAAVARDLADRLDGLAPEDHPAGRPLEERRVLHLSTALCPRDRERILREIGRRQRGETGSSDWVLTATSCVEAGVDLDFQTGFRERCSVASFIQTSGRVNRHGQRANATLYDFTLDTMSDPLLAPHPAFESSRRVFASLWKNILQGDATSELATRAMAMEIADHGGLAEGLTKAERFHDYPDVARNGLVIDADTRTVVVNARLLQLLKAYRRPNPRLIQRLSVQLWANKIEHLGLKPILPRSELFVWEGPYDPLFLGLMCGLLRVQEIMSGGGVV